MQGLCYWPCANYELCIGRLWLKLRTVREVPLPFDGRVEQCGEVRRLCINQVTGKRALVSGFTHANQNIGRCIKTDLHGAPQRFHVARRHEPAVFARLYELRNSGNKCADDRSPQRHCLHDNHRKALGEARQHERPRGQNFVTYLRATDPTRYTHPVFADYDI